MASEINPSLPPTPGATKPPPAGDPIQAPLARPTAAPARERAAAPSRLQARARAFTVADGLMLLIGGLAAWLRFGDLARLPLSAAEATAALANWQFWSAAPMDVAVSSPAYFAFTHLVMSLGAAGDAAARFVPAVFGLLTVLLLWLLRGRARPVMWLAAGLFLAVSPLLVAVSRTAGGDAIALFALLLLVVAGSGGEREKGSRGAGEKGDGTPANNRVVSSDDRGRHTSPAAGGPVEGEMAARSHAVADRWAIIGGAALGLGLASSPLFYTGLAGMLAAVLVGQAERFGGREERKLDSLRHGGIAAGITFAVVATSLLLYPAGLGAALRLFPAWLAQFALPSGNDAFSPLLALLRYEPAVFVLGLPAVVWAAMRGRRAGRMLSVWYGLTLLMVVLQPGVMANAAVATLPAYLLAGLLAAEIAGQQATYPGDGRRTTLYTTLAIVGLGALFLTAAGRFARLNLLTSDNSMLIALAVLAFVLAGAAVVLAMAWESPAARRGALVGAAALLLFWQWGAAWQLSRLGANDPRERWVQAGTDDDVKVLVPLLENISRQVVNSKRDLSIFSQVESPVLRWYLRDYIGFQSGPALPANTSADVIITPADVEPALPSDYFGADFGLAQREIPNVGPMVVSDALKWWLFRESTAATENQRVIVWVRSDLARAE